MVKKKNWYYFLVLANFIFVLTGCAGLADYSVDLPGGNSVVRSSAHQVTIAPKISDSHWGASIIPAKVTEVAWNDHYIVAKQLGMMNDPKSNNGYQIANNDDRHYWILGISTGAVFGPLNEEEFEEKKKEFGIASDVVLKKVEDLKK